MSDFDELAEIVDDTTLEVTYDLSPAQKLEKLIGKAVENGWQAPNNKFHVSDWNISAGERLDNDLVRYAIWFNEPAPMGTIYHWQDILYLHDFAHALFGEELVCGRDGSTKIDQEEAKDTPWRVSCPYENGDYSFAVEAFKYHLQQAVISNDPIGYMYGVVLGE